ncbi:hypothetical protein INS49_006532 [Diaporthe citri]|uniref:uncharacterized protein n=1 Tax=Diaporthe citri TaxID=83186 RepID=UPI001C812C11|nr:uncharacterized protein INS49_006532 [Diaporthe citri]KAG6364928.1 hypothetical protein INS49_006532 [Diaporthe citri]
MRTTTPPATVIPSGSLKSPPSSPLPTPALDSSALRYSYEIGRGETGVLSFEPYKGHILPYWAFRTVPVARNSSEILWAIFESYVERKDFVGADMTRKFIQMGMTRARRYANHKGGRKYAKDTGDKLEKWAGGSEEDTRKRKEKEEASEIFKVMWRRCIEDERFKSLKKDWITEKKDFERSKLMGRNGNAKS